MIWLVLLVVLGGLIAVRIYHDRKTQQLRQVDAARLQASRASERTVARPGALGEAYGMSPQRSAQLAASRAAQDRSSPVIPAPPRSVVIDTYMPLDSFTYDSSPACDSGSPGDGGSCGGD